MWGPTCREKDDPTPHSRNLKDLLRAVRSSRKMPCSGSNPGDLFGLLLDLFLECIASSRKRPWHMFECSFVRSCSVRGTSRQRALFRRTLGRARGRSQQQDTTLNDASSLSRVQRFRNTRAPEHSPIIALWFARVMEDPPNTYVTTDFADAPHTCRAGSAHCHGRLLSRAVCRGSCHTLCATGGMDDHGGPPTSAHAQAPQRELSSCVETRPCGCTRVDGNRLEFAS